MKKSKRRYNTPSEEKKLAQERAMFFLIVIALTIIGLPTLILQHC